VGTINAGRAVVDVLKAEGVRFVFGLPGGHVLRIYDALYDTPEIAHVLVRHEQSAASMASGHAQLTGEPGVCLVTAGPGCTNLLSGIAEAYVGSLPVVVIAGRGATRNALRGAAQEVATDRMFAPVTKWSVRVDRADLIVDALHQAFATARSGKPGPSWSTSRETCSRRTYRRRPTSPRDRRDGSPQTRRLPPPQPMRSSPPSGRSSSPGAGRWPPAAPRSSERSRSCWRSPC
jgi:sulfopyruvate decarboxylase TPP-binding subunit